MPRLRAAASLLVLALALTACGAPARVQTLDNEPDLAGMVGGTVPRGLRDATSAAVTRLGRACEAVDATVRARLTPADGPRLAHLVLADAQCQWIASPSNTGAPELVVGIIEGGDYRFHETAKLLPDELTVAGIGSGGWYDPESRTVFVDRDNRLWYVQVVADPARGAAALRMTTAIAHALLSPGVELTAR